MFCVTPFKKGQSVKHPRERPLLELCTVGIVPVVLENGMKINIIKHIICESNFLHSENPYHSLK